MASTSKQPSVAVSKITLEPMMTLKGNEEIVRSMHYFPDAKRMISGSDDKTTRQWDMQTGKEIEKARDVCGWNVRAVAVSRDCRWVITAGGGRGAHGELKACEVETGIVKTFKGHSEQINCVDICADSTLFASGSIDYTTRIWSLDTGKLVAGPFESADWVGAVRFSRDSKKLAVNSWVGKCLEVWNVQTQILEKRVGHWFGHSITVAPVFWTNKETILAVFSFMTDPEDPAVTIYEFDASTLETVGAPFTGHTKVISGLALSFDGTLVASCASDDDTIKLWAFESRQLLASFHVQLGYLSPLILSPDSGQLTYASGLKHVHICKIPPDILASLGSAIKGQPTETHATPQHLLDSDATRRPRAPHRNPALSPVISCAPTQQRPLPTTRDPPQHAFLRHLRHFLRFSSLTDAGHPVLNEQPRDPLDFPAPSLLHPIHSSSSQATPQGGSHTNRHKNSRRLPASPNNLAPSTTLISFIRRLSTWSVHGTHAPPPVIDVPLAPGRLRVAVAVAPTDDDDLVPAEYFDIPSTNPNSQQSNTAMPMNSGEHGSSRLCFCL